MVYLYKCAYTNCELFSDAFPTKEMFDGFVFAVKSTVVNKEAMKFDMGDCDDIEDKDERVNDIADGFQYNQVDYTLKDYISWLKKYVVKVGKKVQEQNPGNEEIQARFKAACTEYGKLIMANFKECVFYMNAENDTDGAIIVGYWEDASTDKGPTFLYFKDALVREKI